MNLILFGPPGVGKSTLIGILKSIGYRAIDLEDIYPSQIRFQLPNMLNGVILGGADLNPRRSYPHSVRLFLNLEQEVYDARRNERDSKQPKKEYQTRHLISDWLKGVKYDKIIDASGSSRATADEIGRYYDELNSRKSIR